MNCFRQAIEIDPDFALAYSGTAHAYASFGVLGLSEPMEVYPKAKAAIDQALALDDELAEAHAEAASLELHSEWDWLAAERSFQRVFALNPGNAGAHAAHAWFCLGSLRFADAVSEIKLAQQLDPLMPLFYAFSVGIHAAIGKPDEAIEEFKKAMELDPNKGLAYFHVGTAYVRKGMMDDAIAALTKSKELAMYGGRAEIYLGTVYLALGERGRAERILQDLLEQKTRANVSSTVIAFLFGALGNLDKAFEFIERAINERDSLIPYIHVYADLGSLRNDPRFRVLLERLKLPAEQPILAPSFLAGSRQEKPR